MKKALLLSFILPLLLALPLHAQDAKSLLRDAKLAEQESVEKAIGIYKKIISDHPADIHACGEAHLRLGICLARQQRRSEARAAINRAIELCPQRPDVRLLADVTLFRLREGRRQVHRTEVDKHGHAQLVTETSERNASRNEQRFFKVHSSEGTLIAVQDARGRRVPFLWQKRENGIEYTLKFNDPIPPGAEVHYRATWEMERLILRKGDKLLYHFARPMLGQDTLYEHALRLPPGATVGEVSPKPTLTRSTEDGRVMIWQKELDAGKHFDVRVKFTIPNLDVFALAVPDYMEVINKQTNIITVDASGKAVAQADMVKHNNSRVPVSRISFFAGPRAKLLKVRDEQDNLLVFVGTPIGERTSYLVVLRTPIPPGQEQTVKSFYEIKGLMRKEGDIWTYRYRHSPGPETLYSHTLRLPGNAVVVAMNPHTDDVALDEGIQTLSWTDVIARGKHFTCTVKYRLPEAK